MVEEKNVNTISTVDSDNNKTLHVLKLISVGFKEASLDSPSFRANVNFFHSQIEYIETWLDNTSKFSKGKYRDGFNDFKQVYLTLQSQILPPTRFVESGMLDGTETTPELINDFERSLRDVTSQIFQVLEGNPESYLNELLMLLTEVIKPYREKRKNFDYYQTKYDSFLNKYQAAKYQGVDPSTIREDAFQLFEARKLYLKASLDLILEISMTFNRFGEHNIQFIKALKPKIVLNAKNAQSHVDIDITAYKNFEASEKWFLDSIEANKSLEGDIVKAKEQIEEFCIEQITPSRDIEDYNIKTIKSRLKDCASTHAQKEAPKAPSASAQLSPDHPLNKNNGTVGDKSGWLFLKTSVGMPARTIWVRRWCFIRKSVFGMLTLSTSKTHVEETDKFGVLLTSVKYNSANEDSRKFCFDVAISGSPAITLAFQAETFKELESWIRSFAESRQKLVSKNISKEEYEMSFMRFPPIFREFACTSTTSVDLQVTTTTNCKSLVDLLGAELNEYGDVVYNKYGAFQMPTLKTPILTKLTKLSILSTFFNPYKDIPDAITANLWGSVNWNTFCLMDYGSKDPARYASTSYKTVGKPIEYPEYYPQNLINDDLQFKCLFCIINDRLLLKFQCALSPNNKQDFSGTCFVTLHDIYFYLNSTGFICLIRRDIKDIVSCEVSKDQDTINIYKDTGLVMKTRIRKISATDQRINILTEKLQALVINASITDKPLDERQIILKLGSIDKKYEDLQLENLEKEKYLKRSTVAEYSNSDNVSPQTLAICQNNVIANQPLVELLTAKEAELKIRQQEVAAKATYHFRLDFPIEPKALMHILFGENSLCFPKCFSFASIDNYENRVYPWIYYGDGTVTPTTATAHSLKRKLKFALRHIGRSVVLSDGMLEAIQTINKMQDDYCEVEHSNGDVSIPLIGVFKIVITYIITEVPRDESRRKKSSLNVYYTLKYCDKAPATSTTGGVSSFMRNLFVKVLERFAIEDRHLLKHEINHYYRIMGNHGQYVKSVKLGGRITGQESSDNTEQQEQQLPNDDKPTLKFTFRVVLRVLFRWYAYSLVTWLFITVQKIIRGIGILCTNLTYLKKSVVLLLLLSIAMNLYLSSRATLSYWSVKKAQNVVSTCTKNVSMKRAIYLEDLDLLTDSLISTGGKNNGTEMVYKRFINTPAYDRKYKDMRYQIAKRRNDLLVELKILSTMEGEMVKGDFNNFVIHEYSQCKAAKENFPRKIADNESLKEYCTEIENIYDKNGDLKLGLL
ncbi:Sip3p SCDLUD_003912 [Saccharomycodes ludwigii]|uniref:Sip3p n=1 Tax=Saccharomycodes ludwigii TaxID=36035 RepID=UPI001E8BF9CC|nr:hypothetical protein SCDLUD_003912 [Saccharomycodes ludwigii]KAH3899631.1 hypothetical protein SCDLUD_003912 [Saccharomycodes ludwigii]